MYVKYSIGSRGTTNFIPKTKKILDFSMITPGNQDLPNQPFMFYNVERHGNACTYSTTRTIVMVIGVTVRRGLVISGDQGYFWCKFYSKQTDEVPWLIQSMFTRVLG